MCAPGLWTSPQSNESAGEMEVTLHGPRKVGFGRRTSFDTGSLVLGLQVPTKTY